MVTSQELVNLAVPVGLNWNEQSLGSAMMVTLVFCCAACNAGLAICVMVLNRVGVPRELSPVSAKNAIGWPASLLPEKV